MKLLKQLNETSKQMRAMERIRQIEQLELEIEKLHQDGGHDDEIAELKGELELLKDERDKVIANESLNKKIDLPNQDGFEFLAVDKNGKKIKSKVIKTGEAGTHKVRGMKYADIVGWTPLNEK